MKPLVTPISAMLIIEVSMANPNGNPDWDNMPRTLLDGRGLITPVCLKRKIRDTLEDHDSPCFKELVKSTKIDPERFHIFESKTRGFPDIAQHEATKKSVELAAKSQNDFFDKYWDTRLLGCTLLQTVEDKKKDKKDKEKTVRLANTGCLTISPAISIAPVHLIEETLTKKAPLREKDQDIAPSAFKCVEHGLYVATMSINPHVAHRTFATQEDVEILKAVIQHMFRLTTANARPSNSISLVHAWWREHTNALGSFHEYNFFNSLKPHLNTETPKSINDYSIPNGKDFGAIDLVDHFA